MDYTKLSKIILIPATFINKDDLEAVKTQEDIKGLMTLKMINYRMSGN